MTIGAPIAARSGRRIAARTDAQASAPVAPDAASTQPAPSTVPARRTSSWPAVAAWGAGLLQLALGAGALTGAGGKVWLGVAGATLVILGAGELVWGAAALARGRIVVPRVGVAGALVGIVAATATLMLDPERTSILAVAATSLLLISVGVGCGIALRRGLPGGDVRTGLLGLFVAAVLVAGVVTPALGATEAGRNAPSHSGHDLVFNEHQH
ncbi:hypothetical protein [Microbacterium rhizomatis]|uniref:Uncharacterized protein n=1 Tax=Microbacterium rhizomatis TaxID=1631477 RepID=A0A5J5IWG4_9MICO|nr:hypothetical protein [Microbacterium rhizomatis]KAA9105023.1 hypothetical protein F6B43_18425 [Microbacterium rhizomatis]